MNSLLCRILKKPKPKNPSSSDTENRLVVARGSSEEVGEMGERGQKVKTSSCKIVSHGDVIRHGDHS